MRTRRPLATITVGDIATPAYWRNRGYLAIERRDYHEGITVFLIAPMAQPDTVRYVMAFYRDKGCGTTCQPPRAITRPWRDHHSITTIVQEMRRVRAKAPCHLSKWFYDGVCLHPEHDHHDTDNKGLQETP